MAVPEGYISLGFVGFTDRGDYSPDNLYARNDLVHQDNAIWKCLIDGTIGIDPAPDVENWVIYIQSQTKMSGITVMDTFGVLGDTREIVVAQEFMDSLAEKVMEQMLTKSGLVNNALATVPGVSALDSAMGSTFQEQIDCRNGNLSNVYRVPVVRHTSLYDYVRKNIKPEEYKLICFYGLTESPFSTPAGYALICYNSALSTSCWILCFSASKVETAGIEMVNY